VDSYNHEHLMSLHRAVVQINAKHEGAGADRVESSNAGNLVKRLPLCLGCRVMLTRNLWANLGLVNGAQGTVYDISWAEGANVSNDPPQVIMVAFDSYTGPPFLTPDGEELRDGSKLVVPILRVRQEFTLGASTGYREQFPLLVCYAITVHKSQGVTLDKAVYDISAPEFASGLSYVAVSRVKTLDGLMFESPFDRSRIYREVPVQSMQLKILDYDTRMLQLLDPPEEEEGSSNTSEYITDSSVV
jgi:ATP-dependent exoDNAse (exonuclease V) alpha subunit